MGGCGVRTDGARLGEALTPCTPCADTLEKWGSMTLPDVLAPSIELAQHGFPVAPVTAYHWEAGMAQLRGGAHGEVRRGRCAPRRAAAEPCQRRS